MATKEHLFKSALAHRARVVAGRLRECAAAIEKGNDTDEQRRFVSVLWAKMEGHEPDKLRVAEIVEVLDLVRYGAARGENWDEHAEFMQKLLNLEIKLPVLVEAIRSKRSKWIVACEIARLAGLSPPTSDSLRRQMARSKRRVRTP